MRFAIFGDHPDGLRLAQALSQSGRHQVVAQATGTPTAGFRYFNDIEEVLADPNIEAIVVASSIDQRLNHLRRVLQSERSAFCVHPVDLRPDGAYEIHMLQGDAHQVVLPIMPEWFSPAIEELKTSMTDVPTNAVLGIQICQRDGAVLPSATGENRSTLPGWTILRRVGGDIVEVAAFAKTEELHESEPVVGFGKFPNGRLFQVAWLSDGLRDSVGVSILGSAPEAPTEIRAADATEWNALIERFDRAVARLKSAPRVPPGSGPALDLRDGLGWHDEIRAAELNDLARRSIERRRVYSLDFQEATEEVGFKGTMTLVGCALLWMLPVVALLFAWVPKLAWIVLAVLLVFLALQLLKAKSANRSVK